MNTIKIPGNGHTRLIAHRGLSGLERENTCAAFVAAGNRSHTGIETDIHITADGQYVIIHDHETGRVATENLPVEGSPLATLRGLFLTDTDGEVRGDLQLPLLEEYLRICHKYGKLAVIEFKGVFTPVQLADIRRLVQTHHDEENTVYISFQYEIMVALRAQSDTVRLQYLCGRLTEEELQDMAARRIGVDALHATLDGDTVAQIHALGLEVNCWTVDDPAEAARLMEAGVDYITTNILELEE